ncbi:MAG: GAF domain-containing protein [Litorilinea sp.]
MTSDSTQKPLDALFHQNPLPMWIYDTETLEFLEVNHAAQNIYGYSRAEFLSMTIADIRSPEEQARLHQFRRHGLPGWTNAGIWQHLTKSNRSIYVRIVSHIYPFKDRPARLVSALDVTDQKRAEMETAAALERAKRNTVQLQRVNRLAQRVNIGNSTSTLLQQIVDEARQILGAHQAVMSLTVDQQWRQSLSAVALSDKYAAYSAYDAVPDGTGIYRLVCESNQPMRMTQAQLKAHPAWHNFGPHADKHPPINGWLAAPLIDRDGKNVGLIQMSDKYEGEFDADDETILIQIAHMASGILDNAKLYTALQTTEARVTKLYTMSRHLAVLNEHAAVMQTSIDEARDLINAPWGVFVFIPNKADATAQFEYAVSGLEPNATLPIPILDGKGRIGEMVFHQQQPLRIEDVRALEIYGASSLATIAESNALDLRAFLAVPVVSNKGRSLGGLFFGSQEVGAFARHHQQLAEAVAAHAGVTLEKLLLQAEIEEHAATLETRVAERTAQLEQANSELEAFTYSVSHDLRAPLRGIDGFSQILLERYSDKLDERGTHYLTRIRAGTERMAQLINDLLELSRVTRKDIARRRVNLTRLAHNIIQEIQQNDPERQVRLEIADDLVAQGDEQLLGIVIHNLLDNAWKFTGKTPDPVIRFQHEQLDDGRTAFCISDNGAGFDMAYSNKLFGVFQRLHRAGEFPGTGVGLATVQRIIHRHHGEIWAESAPNQGARFWFTVDQQ